MQFSKFLASTLTSLVLVSSLMLPACAQPAIKKIPNHPRVNQVNQRRADQRARIHQGVKSGQLTGSERHSLNTQERGIHSEEHTMRSEDNGHLTKADQRSLNQQQNQVSKDIFQDKHNGATQPGVTPASP
jgi:hypothetical protein